MVVDVETGLLVVNGKYIGNLITKTGPGILNSGSTQNATFSGKWAVTGGSLAFGLDNRIGVVPTVTVPDAITVSNGGKFRTGASFDPVAIDVHRGMTIGVGGGGFDAPFDVGTSKNLTTIWNGPITGNVGGDLQMSGVGTVVLNNTANDWDGATTISAGFLRVGASGVIPDTSVVTQSGGTFDLATTSTSETVKSISGTAGKIALAATSVLTLANPAGETAAQTLNVKAGGKIIKNGNGTLTLSGGAQNNDDQTGFNGEFILNSGILGVGTSTMLGGGNTPTATLTINGGKLCNPDDTSADPKNFNAALIVNLSGDFTVDQSLNATPGVIRFNGSTATIRNSNRTITVNGVGVLDFEGTVTEDVPGRSLTKAGNGGMVLGGANTYTGGTFVTGGTLVAANGDAFAGGALAVADGATAKINPATAKAVTLTTLNTNTSGKVDLTDNSMVIKGLTVDQVRSLIQGSFNAGHWNGATGLDSSTAAANAGGTTAIGYGGNNILNKTVFKGVTPLSGTDVLVKYTYYGDADLSGNTTLDDFTLFLGGYQNGGATWAQGDFDYSGGVTLDDFTLFLKGYQQQGAQLSQLEGLINRFPMSDAERAGMLAAVQAVPEPAGLGLLGMAAAAGGLLRWRRSRR
jgi:autotransporter-associated beta strand protein